MNILREVRRVQQKSLATRIRLLLSFSVILIVTTYAWKSSQKDVKGLGLQGDITSWDVSYYVNEDTNEILDEIATFTIDDLYPGMPVREDVAHIYNRGKSSTNIRYEIISVKVFEEEVLDELNITTTQGTNGTTIHIFSADTEYPFEVSYTYDKSKLIGQYEEGGEYADSAHATCKFNVSWEYEGNGTETENEEKDILDTIFGKEAYQYYQTAGSDVTKAIEIKVKITSSMIHPSVDPDYPYAEN